MLHNLIGHLFIINYIYINKFAHLKFLEKCIEMSIKIKTHYKMGQKGQMSLEVKKNRTKICLKNIKVIWIVIPSSPENFMLLSTIGQFFLLVLLNNLIMFYLLYFQLRGMKLSKCSAYLACSCNPATWRFDFGLTIQYVKLSGAKF
jgi:hypothetical protein